MELDICLKNFLSKSEKLGIYNILNICDNDFVPPLSSRDSFKDKNFNIHHKEKTIDKYFQSIISSSNIYAIASDKAENKIIALSVLEEKIDNSLYLSTICVLLNYRNQGICKKLLETIINYATTNNYTNLYTRTWSTNSIQKRALENMGFELINTEKESRTEEVYSLYYNLNL